MNNIQNKIAECFSDGIEHLKSDYSVNSLTDIFIFIDNESGEMFVHDDEEHLLSQIIIEEWIGCEDNLMINAEIRSVMEKLDKESFFDTLDIYKPFSISIVDENFAVQEELFLIEDDSIIRLENDFLEKMDKEFDNFLEKLLKD